MRRLVRWVCGWVGSQLIWWVFDQKGGWSVDFLGGKECSWVISWLVGWDT